jgi:hypothetical protein
LTLGVRADFGTPGELLLLRSCVKFRPCNRPAIVMVRRFFLLKKQKSQAVGAF